MKAAVFYGPRDIRIDQAADPKLKDATDAIVRVTHSCVCGSDLWSFRGMSDRKKKTVIGHEFIGIVEEIGAGVKKIKNGDFVISPFSRSDGICPECLAGISSSCRNGGYWGEGGYGACQAEFVRVPNSDHMLFKVPKNKTSKKLMPAFLALSDVLCTGYHAAVCAGVGKEKTVAVIGDGAVGLCAVLSSKFLGAKKIILLSTHPDRAKLGRKLGASDIVSARGEKAFKAVRKLTKDTGADCVLECVGTKESWKTAFKIVRKGGRIGWVGVPHDVAPINIGDVFGENVGIMGGRAPAASYIPKLLPHVLSGELSMSGDVFTKTIKLGDIQKGYEAMDKRREIKVLIKL
ncbi:MAG: Alcohol dehydrogenase GroES protein [uncultured bacterium]|nr:MAG: Alcohol dehydrogenase GroES protein [uncultured bacterium]OGH13978.1 MAG: hypothetical protein A2687_05765 [Candidatus Levybacteria bacterium RIFCSPHIGHO2_01_FULL_38_26]